MPLGHDRRAREHGQQLTNSLYEFSDAVVSSTRLDERGDYAGVDVPCAAADDDAVRTADDCDRPTGPEFHHSLKYIAGCTGRS